MNVSPQANNHGNQLTYCYKTKKMVLNSQTVRPKNKPHLSDGEPSHRQTSGTDPPMNRSSHGSVVIKSET